MKFEDIKTSEQLLNFLTSAIKYGFVFGDKKFTEPINFEDMKKFYQLKFGNDLINSEYGLCWDAVELERLFFEKMHIENKSFFIEAFGNGKNEGPTHAFILFKKDNKIQWFEYTWEKYRGIHDYKTEKEALKDIASKHVYFHFGSKQKNKFVVYEYQKITEPLNPAQFIKHCYSGEKISV